MVSHFRICLWSCWRNFPKSFGFKIIEARFSRASMNQAYNIVWLIYYRYWSCREMFGLFVFSAISYIFENIWKWRLLLKINSQLFRFIWCNTCATFTHVKTRRKPATRSKHCQARKLYWIIVDKKSIQILHFNYNYQLHTDYSIYYQSGCRYIQVTVCSKSELSKTSKWRIFDDHIEMRCKF